MDENTLYYGDNLDILQRYIKDETIDLVYLDPPFKSNQNYNVLFKEKNGAQAASQIRAFEDTWTWSQDDEAIYADLVTKGGKVADCLQAFRTFLGPCDMLAYLVMMAPRLIELRRVMKLTASIYLHCDPAASHYLKMMMDAVFGTTSYRTEIIWRRGSGFKRASAKRFPHKHDTILFYCRDSERLNFHPQYRPHKAEYVKRFKKDKDGRLYRDDVNPTRGGRRVIYLDEVEGDLVDSIWNDINPLNPVSAERLGYPTQKPEALLERIIRASTNEGDLVLDPFSGCGTTVNAAQKLKRRWIGIDITHLAITLMKKRLLDTFGAEAQYKVVGEPTSLPDAAALAESDPYQFQWWALGLVGARPVEQKKGADKGIDGKIVFQGDAPGQFENVVISVKAGHLMANHVRDLRGVVEGREKAAIGVLISMEDPTKPMQTEAVTAGFFESKTWGCKYPKIQLLTVADLLAGKKVEMPPIKQVSATFKKAERFKGKEGEQMELAEKGK
jgi:site-specific DNA-methyltransferase (adenine-specific)